MLRWMPKTNSSHTPQRWQSRAEILKAHLQSLPPEELLRVRPAYYALTYGYDFVRRRFKANFNPSQPRVPAGNSDGGQWTREGGGGLSDSRVISDANDEWKPGAQYAAGPRGPRDRLPPLHVPRAGEGDVSPYQPGRITIENNAQTGISTVDETTEKLRAILEEVVNAKGEGYGPEYGKEVHYDFADGVKEAIRSGDLRGDIRVEHTYPEGRDFRYGSKGSIRTDVVLRNELGEVIVIYDVKTGGAYLDVRRLGELRAKTNTNLSVPVVEMHVLRGLSLKGRAAKAKHLWFITLRLWNPWYEMVADREANAAGF